jgi:hypothetical protein
MYTEVNVLFLGKYRRHKILVVNNQNIPKTITVMIYIYNIDENFKTRLDTIHSYRNLQIRFTEGNFVSLPQKNGHVLEPSPKSTRR